MQSSPLSDRPVPCTIWDASKSANSHDILIADEERAVFCLPAFLLPAAERSDDGTVVIAPHAKEQLMQLWEQPAGQARKPLALDLVVCCQQWLPACHFCCDCVYLVAASPARDARGKLHF
jgi:hypothetical protein